jgi:hypothetical protein
MERNSGGLSEAGLRRLRDVLERHVESGRIPGVVARVSRGGGEAHVEAIGSPWLAELADREVLKGVDGPLDETIPVGILCTQVGASTPEGGRLMHDFWTTVYQAIED